MRISKEYKEALAEVLCILKCCDEQVIEKIPLEVIKGIKKNAIDTEECSKKFEKYDGNIEGFALRQETIALLATIYKKYLCTDEEREAYGEKLLKAEELLEEDTVSSDIFKASNNKQTKEHVENENLPKEIKKESIFTKVINKVKNMFRK